MWTTCWREVTKNWLQELAKDMAMRWGMMTDKLQSSWVVLCAVEFRVTT